MPGRSGRVVIWGDGAVGRGLAVALSRICEIALVGPPGSGAGQVQVASTGVIRGVADVTHFESDSAPAGDACMVAVKAYAISRIARAVFDSSIHVVCFSNGMGLEEAWGSRVQEVEPCVVLGGFAAGPGWVVETHPGGFVAARGGMAADWLGRAGLEPVLAGDLGMWRWAKWLLNSSLNPVAALAGAGNDELGRLGLEPLIAHLQSELSIVVPPDVRAEAVLEASRLTGFLLENSANRCSMLQDLERGRPTEIDYLAGLAGRRLPGLCPTAEALAALIAARAGPASATQRIGELSGPRCRLLPEGLRG
jgi:ketopantoate reductase